MPCYDTTLLPLRTQLNTHMHFGGLSAIKHLGLKVLHCESLLGIQKEPVSADISMFSSVKLFFAHAMNPAQESVIFKGIF